MKVSYFRTDKIKYKLNYEDCLNSLLPDKKYAFSYSGKQCIINILHSFEIRNSNVILPYYLCDSVKAAVQKSGNTPIYADINLEDLNISINSIKKIVEQRIISAVIVPSLYGNPANLTEIEFFCRNNQIIMIDDAAQSYGATLDNRKVGEFGDAGFYSFGASKPFRGNGGAVYWSNRYPRHQDELHEVYHLINHLGILFQKRWFYEDKGGLEKVAHYLLYKLKNVCDKKLSGFNESLTLLEKKKILKLLVLYKKGYYNYLKEYYNEFSRMIKENSQFQLLKQARGVGNVSRIVLRFLDNAERANFLSYLKNHNISYFKGYSFFQGIYDSERKVKDTIVELPIDFDPEQRDYLLNKVNEYIK
ncbi:MAG: DegT/DnrJ/EryC1/StrS family aminotransferase [Saprospiraceae bacterium]|nr:DegT/DnrJ/EryC1/StrS family aminotransferase [Saprospiraceae bacterium]